MHFLLFKPLRFIIVTIKDFIRLQFDDKIADYYSSLRANKYIYVEQDTDSLRKLFLIIGGGLIPGNKKGIRFFYSFAYFPPLTLIITVFIFKGAFLALFISFIWLFLSWRLFEALRSVYQATEVYIYAVFSFMILASTQYFIFNQAIPTYFCYLFWSVAIYYTISLFYYCSPLYLRSFIPYYICVMFQLLHEYEKDKDLDTEKDTCSPDWVTLLFWLQCFVGILFFDVQQELITKFTAVCIFSAFQVYFLIILYFEILNTVNRLCFFIKGYQRRRSSIEYNVLCYYIILPLIVKLISLLIFFMKAIIG